MEQNSGNWVDQSASQLDVGTRSSGVGWQRVRCDIEDGLKLANLRSGSTLQVMTRHTCYTIRILLGRLALISGHPLYCPQPVLVTIYGSTGEGSRLEAGFIGRGRRLTFHHPEHGTSIVTSRIHEIRECPAIDRWSIASIVAI